MNWTSTTDGMLHQAKQDHEIIAVIWLDNKPNQGWHVNAICHDPKQISEVAEKVRELLTVGGEKDA